MTNSLWPLFDLSVTTPRLELRYVDDDLAAQLASLAARGVHDPSLMPFRIPWTDVASPQLERNALQWYWRCRADTSPSNFHLTMAVLVDGEAVGTTSLEATDFAILHQFETGSWLGQEHHGQGIGTEMRIASLQLGFAGLGATLATTSAFHDNGPSLGVTRRLGYTPTGSNRLVRRGQAATTLEFEMTRQHWNTHVRRDDIDIHGLDACRPLLGLATAS
jgi:RimJ/RimL family protein N-acetyltransferase